MLFIHWHSDVMNPLTGLNEAQQVKQFTQWMPNYIV